MLLHCDVQPASTRSMLSIWGFLWHPCSWTACPPLSPWHWSWPFRVKASGCNNQTRCPAALWSSLLIFRKISWKTQIHGHKNSVQALASRKEYINKLNKEQFSVVCLSFARKLSPVLHDKSVDILKRRKFCTWNRMNATCSVCFLGRLIVQTQCVMFWLDGTNKPSLRISFSMLLVALLFGWLAFHGHNWQSTGVTRHPWQACCIYRIPKEAGIICLAAED